MAPGFSSQKSTVFLFQLTLGFVPFYSPSILTHHLLHQQKRRCQISHLCPPFTTQPEPKYRSRKTVPSSFTVYSFFSLSSSPVSSVFRFTTPFLCYYRAFVPTQFSNLNFLGFFAIPISFLFFLFFLRKFSGAIRGIANSAFCLGLWIFVGVKRIGYSLGFCEWMGIETTLANRKGKEFCELPKVTNSNSKTRKSRRRQKKMSLVQKLFETCKEVFSIDGVGNVPSPENVQRLRSVLGMFCQKFYFLFFILFLYVLEKIINDTMTHLTVNLLEEVIIHLYDWLVSM